MRRIAFLVAAAFCVSAMSTIASASTYFSQGSVTPNTLTNWNTVRLGGGSSPANFTSGDIFVIQGTGNGGTSPHSMTTTATWTVSGVGAEVQIENGASLSLANTTTVQRLTILAGGSANVTGAVAFTVNNGNAAGFDLSVAGTLTLSNAGSSFAFGAGATGEFLSGGAFTLARNGGGGGTIPTATWDANSTVNITGVTSTAAGGDAQAFGNVTWNSAVQSATLNFTPTSIAGDFLISNTNSQQLRVQTTALTVGGDFTQSGATSSTRIGSNTARTWTVAGNVSITGGTIDMSDGNSPGTINVAGDFSITGGTLTESGSSSGEVVFNKAGTQIYTSGGTITNSVNFTVNSGSTLQMAAAGSIVAGGGTFDTVSGATLGIRSTVGITTSGATGNVQVTGTRTYATGTSYIYNGSANQAVGNGLTQNTPANLTIANTGVGGSNTVSLGATTTISGSLIMTSGILNLAANATTVGDLQGSANITSNTAGAVTLTTGSNNASTTYSGVISNGSGTVALTKNGTGTLTLSGANTYSGTTTLSAGTLNINNATAIGSGTFTISGASTIDNTSGGAITLSNNNAQNWNADFTFTGTNALNLGTGAVTLNANRQVTASASTLTVGGGITGGTRNLTKGGAGTLVLNGVIGTTTGNVTVNAGTLTLAGTNTYTGGTTLSAGTLNINNTQALGTVAGTFTISGGTIDNTSGTSITTLNYPLALNGDFSYSGSVPRDLNLGTGAVTLNANRQITVSAGTLTIGGTISASTRDLTKVGAGTLSFGSQTVTLNSLTISTGTLRSTSGTMNLAGNLTNNGTFTHNSGTVTFNGSSAQTIGGSVATAFSSLTINNSGTGVTLDTSTDVGASVSTALTLTTDLIVSDPDFLNETGVITANSTGAGDVIGDVRRTDAGTTTRPFGNADVLITNGNALAQLDVYLAKSAPGGFAGAVTRNYTIVTAGSVSGATLRLRYLQSELNGNTEASLTLWRAVGSPSATWTNQGQTSRNGVVNWVELSGVGGFSTWTLADGTAGHAPTLVRLTGFMANVLKDGVMLEWKSGFEANNLGYNVYRYQDGQRTRVTPSLIAGSALITKGRGLLTSGFSYGWFDAQGSAGTQYELEAVDLRGDRQTFAPRYAAINAYHGDPKKGRSLMLAEIATASRSGANAQHGWATGTAMAPAKQTAQQRADSLATQQWVAAQPGVKIRVNQTGWYRVTQPQLVAAGFDAAADAAMLQLYVDGSEVPIRLGGNGPKLGPTDSLEFYGVGLDALTTDTHTYYLVSGTQPGLRIRTEKRKPEANRPDPVSTDFAYTVESKERMNYLPGLLNGDSDNIFGQIVMTDPAIQTMTLRNVDTESTVPVQLNVILQGFTEVAHQVQVQLNGAYVGTINFSGATHQSSTLAVNSSFLREGANTVTMTAAGGDSDISVVDAVRVTYAHAYRADNDLLTFSVGNRSAVVGGFSSPAIRVVDVTDPNAVREVTPNVRSIGSGYGFTLQSSGTTRNLIAFVNNLAGQPSAMLRNQPSNWNASTNGADLVILTHGDFRQSADQLAAARRTQGMQVSVVDVEDAFDEFSYGVHKPEALKDFLAWSSTHWTKHPAYALLFGDSSWDPRNYLGQGNTDFVPTKLVDTAELETASDDWLADFDGDGIPEIAIGRLPARTGADAAVMVSKIFSYDQERAGGANLRGALLVADAGFESQTAQVQSLLTPITTVQTLQRSVINNDDAMRTQIVNAIDQGPAIVNYFGHGSVGVWTGAGLLNQDNASTLTNGNHLSFFVMMTCFNGYSQDAYVDSLSETLLRDPQGGAFAVWASSGQTEPDGQAQMNTQVYQLLLGNQPMTLGEAVRHAKMSTADFDVRRTWILLGDPSMRLK